MAAERIAVGFDTSFAVVPHGSTAELARPELVCALCAGPCLGLLSCTAEPGWQKGNMARSGMCLPEGAVCLGCWPGSAELPGEETLCPNI